MSSSAVNGSVRPPYDFSGKTVLITGGTGSFGKHMTRMLLEQSVRKILIFSRDELKQSEMQQQYPDPRMRFFLGDIRDYERLRRAFHDVDVVIHAAALKQVPAAEYNPFEAIKTNVLGAENIINAALDCGVPKVVALSTDKAVNPVNLYGATKLCSDKLFIAGNSYAGGSRTRFSVVRYGNVVGSRGSVIPLYLKLRETGRIPVTDPRMTRFWITLDKGVELVATALGRMKGGEIFVPKIPSMNILDLARAIAPDCEINHVGIRPGEKLHEALITEDDSRNTLEYPDSFIIQPAFSWWDASPRQNGGVPVQEGFRYSSDSNSHWLTVADLREIVFSPQAALV